MNDLHEFRLQGAKLDALRAFALEEQRSLDDIVEAALDQGMNAMRQKRFFEQRMRRAKSSSAESVIQMLRTAGGTRPPDLGDELPEDIGYLLKERA